MNQQLKIPYTVALSLLVSLSGCGKKKSDSNDNGSDTTTVTSNGGGVGNASTAALVSTDKPADSTGATSTLNLGFGTASSSAAALALAAGATSLDLGNGIILTDARVSVGAIKIKANKETSADEKAARSAAKQARDASKAETKTSEDALEQQKDDIKKKYEPLAKAAVSNAEKEQVEANMKAELALIEQDRATLHAAKDDEVAAHEAQQDGNVRWVGPYVYDLVANSVAPALPPVDLVDGSYRRIEFKVRPNRAVDATDALLNNAVYIAGKVLLGGVAIPFTISMPIEEEFKLMGAGAFKVDPTLNNALTIAFDPAGWFSAVDFSKAVKDGLGSITISDSLNADIYEALLDNLKRSTRFGDDKDHDGKLKSDEAEGAGDEGVAAQEAEAAESAASAQTQSGAK